MVTQIWVNIGSSDGLLPDGKKSSAKVFTMQKKLISVFPGLFYKHGLTLISAWISNHIHYKVWDEFIYPFLNFNGCIFEV